MVITGTTQIYLMLADPIAQVRTPKLLNSWLQAQAIDAAMVSLHICPVHPGRHMLEGQLRLLTNFFGLE